jgi:hypothetical protein
MHWWHYQNWFSDHGWVADIQPRGICQSRWLDHTPPMTVPIIGWMVHSCRVIQKQRVLLPFASTCGLHDALKVHEPLYYWAFDEDIDDWTAKYSSNGNKCDTLLIHSPAKETFYALEMLWPYLGEGGTCAAVVPYGILFADDEVCQEQRELCVSLGAAEYVEIKDTLNIARERLCIVHLSKEAAA